MNRKIAIVSAAAALAVLSPGAAMMPLDRAMEPAPEPARQGGKYRRKGRGNYGINPEKERIRQETNAKIEAQQADPGSINEKYLSAAARRRRRSQKQAKEQK